MEPHKQLDSSTENLRPSFDNPFSYFEKAYAFAHMYYSEQIEQISSVKNELVEPDHFFREYIWVVHATGFSAKAVGNFMPRLIEAYGSHNELAERSLEKSIERVRIVCNNPQKIKAVHSTARKITNGIKIHGWEKFRKENLSTPEQLQKLEYIGPITRYHLARNIGLLEYVKPDLHLIRLSDHWGFENCIIMCEQMRDEHKKLTGEVIPLGIIDLIMWYAASHFGTMEIRKAGAR